MGRPLYINPLERLVLGSLACGIALILVLRMYKVDGDKSTFHERVRSGLLVGSGLWAIGAYTVGSVVRDLWLRSRALKTLPGPRYNPFFGCLDVLRRPDPHRWLSEVANKYGPIAKIRVITFHAVIVTDPALAVHVLHSPLLDKFSFMYSFLDALLNGPSILTGPTDNHWKQVRKAIAPAFSTSHMRDATQLVVEKSEQLVRHLCKEGPSKPQNMDKLLLRESMDVIGRFGFAKEMHALDTLDTPSEAFENGLSDVDVLLGATKEIEDRLGGPHRAFQWWKKELWHGAYLLRRYRKQVSGLLKHIKAHVQRKDSFAELLLKARHHKTGNLLSSSEMTPEIAALFFAGIDTTGHTGTWLLYLLSQHPEVEAKVVEELDDLELLVTEKRPNPRPLTYSDLGKLVYLQAVVKEVLRMYPPVGIGQLREALTDIVISDKLRIPKGCLVWVPHYALQNAPFNWSNPDEFQPERWMESGVEFANISNLPLSEDWYKDLNLENLSTGSLSKVTVETGNARRPKRYFPFAEGPRNCVGQSLAKVSLVATAATLLSHLSFKLADQMGGREGVRAREEYKLVTGIRDGMWMHPIPRGRGNDI